VTQDFYQTIVNQSPIGYAYQKILFNDSGLPCDFQFIYVNPAFKEILGLKSQEIAGKRATEIIPGIEKDSLDWIQIYGDVVVKGKNTVLEQYSAIFHRWLHIQSYSTSKPYFITRLSDASPLAIPQAEEFFKRNLDLLCIIDTAGKFLKINQEWQSVLGYAAQELEGKNLLSFVHPHDVAATLSVIATLEKQQPLRDFVNRYQCKDGTYRYLEWSAQPDKQFIYASARDITEKVEENKCFELMIDSSKEFLQMSHKNIEYQKMTDVVLLLSGALAVTFNLYDKSGSALTTVAISAEKEAIKKAEAFLGYSIVGTKWILDTEHNNKIQQEDLTVFPNLFDIAGKLLPKSLSHRIQGAHQMGQVIVAKIMKDNRMLGDFTIMMPAGKELRHNNLIKAYSHQVGLLVDRIRSEEALVKSEAMLEEAQSIARLGRWEWDYSSGMVSFSHGVNELFELDAMLTEVTYQQFLDYIHPADKKRVQEFDVLQRQGKSSYEIVFRVNVGDGHTKWIQENGRILTDNAGNPIRTIGTVQDITKLKESEEKIQKLLTENETIFNGTQEMLFLVEVKEGPSFAYIRNNVAHQKETGVPLKNFTGKTPQEIFGQEIGETITRNYLRCINNRRPICYKETLPSSFGIKAWETTLTPVFENDKPIYIVGSSQPLNARKEFQKRILQNLKHNRILVNVLKHPIESEQEYLYYALNQAISLTKSKYGYIYLYDDKTETFTVNTWSNGVMEACHILEKEIQSKLASTGIWGEVVRQKKPILINDFTKPHALKKGYPQGHINLSSFLSIPILDQGTIVAVVGVANKKDDYTEDDILHLTLLMNNVWAVIQRKRSEDLLKKEKDLFKTTLLSIGEGILATDYNGIITVINEVAQNLIGWSQEAALGKSFQEVFYLIDEKTGEKCIDPIQQVIETGQKIPFANHMLLVSPNGSLHPIAVSAAPIIGEYGDLQGVVLAFRDVTHEKQKIEAIEYLSYHDQLTGLYNRAFFDVELKRLDTRRNLPLTIVMGDVNGLKLTNDAFGHIMGDHLLQKAGQVMRECCRSDDIIARTGGDEFVILLPQTTFQEGERIIERIRQLCAKTFAGSVTLSISFGWASKTSAEEDVNDIKKNAEDMMYRRKLFESPSVRGKTISAIVQTLYETHPREEAHSKRVSQLSKAIALKLGFNEREVKEIVTAALLHDIGKIAISGHLLNKSGKLTCEEAEEIRRHPEIGYRILSSVNDLAETADCILAHHERWDGKGYPKGLKGLDILLQARIIAIADAFDAMTCERPYRRALSRDEALEQIRKNGGKQFDPYLTKIFLSLRPGTML